MVGLSQAFDSAGSGTAPMVVFIVIITAALLFYIGMKVPLMWTIARFGYSNALYNSRINRFARRLYVNNLMGTSSFSEAVNFVSSASPRDFPLKNVTTMEGAEHELFTSLLTNLEEAKKESPKMISPVLDTFIIRYENRMLKGLFRQRFHEGSSDAGKIFPVGEVDGKIIDNMRNAESVTEMVDYIPRKDLRNMLERCDRSTIGGVEHALDRFYLESMEKASAKVPRAIRAGMKEFLEVQIDMINLKNLLRMIKTGVPEERKKEYAFTEGKNVHGGMLERICEAETIAEAVEAIGTTPYGPLFREVFKDYKTTGRISLFELELDKFWINYVENFAMKMNTTVGPVIRYLTEREFEIRNIVSVLRGLSIPGGKKIAGELMVYREGA